jgi:D-glycero-beta-D-manno-heptose 1-phosphate adenylyltransferase
MMIVSETLLPNIINCFQGRRKVFTVGSFDLLHAGHIGYLNWCAQRGDILIVGVNSDTSITRDKGPTRPLIPQADRVTMVDSLQMVDITTLTESVTGLPYEESIQTALLCRPDVIVLGNDWGWVELPYWKEALPDTKILICPKRHGASCTSAILESIVEKAGR